MNKIIKQVNAIFLKVLVATTMLHVFIYTPYLNQLMKQVNQISFKYIKTCLLFVLTYPYSEQCKAKSSHLGGWEGTPLHSICLPKFDFH